MDEFSSHFNWDDTWSNTDNTTDTIDSTNKHSVHHSSNSQTWNTPLSLYNPLCELWNFTLDVACLPDSALCTKYFTPDDDGLAQDWSNDVCWCNPPYDNIKEWTEKCAFEYSQGATIVMLIPSRTDTKAFQDYIAKTCDYVVFLKGRLKFDNPIEAAGANPPKKNNGAPFPSLLAVWDNNVTPEKYEHLLTLGVVMKVGI